MRATITKVQGTQYEVASKLGFPDTAVMYRSREEMIAEHEANIVQIKNGTLYPNLNEQQRNNMVKTTKNNIESLQFKNHQNITLRQIDLDLPRQNFLDNKRDNYHFFKRWRDSIFNTDCDYVQGNMVGGSLCHNYYTNDDPMLTLKLRVINFGYIADGLSKWDGATCGLTICYLSDNPKEWILSILENGSAPPKQATQYFYICGDKKAVAGEQVDLEDLFSHIRSAEIRDLLTHLISPNGEINTPFFEQYCNKGKTPPPTKTYKTRDLILNFPGYTPEDLVRQYQKKLTALHKSSTPNPKLTEVYSDIIKEASAREVNDIHTNLTSPK
ncbi:MAG: hypothetical protein KDH94_06225 [Coxiellaceae bacterium]|nr:hypothetical protein [Coxiellaceae bacterium]